MTKEKAVSNGVIHNTIAPGTHIVGTITAENDFRIDGNIDGDIICQGKVVIGKQALVKGNMTCANAEIVGTMDGHLKISEVLTLKSTSVFTGDMKIATLIVEPNARFNGTCEMLQPSQVDMAK